MVVIGRGQGRCRHLLFVVGGLLLTGCGPPVAAGTWEVVEFMVHRCRTASDKALRCDPEDGLEDGERGGFMVIAETDAGRLRLVDVDGRPLVGQSFADGARFRRLERRSGDGEGCAESTEEIVELHIADDVLDGQRRILSTLTDCGRGGSTDEGFALNGRRHEAGS